MDKSDLLKMLDLEGKEALPVAEDLAIASTEPAAPSKPASPTALELDDWAVRRGQDLLEDSERLQALAMDDHAVADFHGAVFLPEPELRPDCRDRLRHELVQELLRTRD